MKESLVEQLLSKIMNWEDNKIVEELPKFQFMAEMKYDHYDQFMPGTRFLGSLSKWLSNFEEEERNVMFDFVKNKLIFISSSQMTYLITLLYRTCISSALAHKTAEEMRIPPYKINGIKKSETYKREKRLALFIGLSDGAHMDVVRRVGGLSNEQVLTNYYPDKDKLEDMRKELLNDSLLKELDKSDRKFNSLYLIDDFTASGTSFIRKDTDQYKGKLTKIINKFFNSKVNETSRELLLPNVDIHIIFCLATQCAISHIENLLSEFIKSRGLEERISFDVRCVQIIPNRVANEIKNDTTLVDIIKKEKYINKKNVGTKSYKVGHGEQEYFGYGDGALPLVLSHNTPNNSILVLWQDDDDNYPSLFPRINRH